MENIKELVSAGIKLSEKKTWLEKGYSDLHDLINKELAKIPDMDEAEISYLVREYEYESCKRKIYCRLILAGDAYLKLIIKKDLEYDWVEEKITKPTTATIREFAKKLKPMFEFFLSEIEKRNTDYDEAIGIIDSIVSKLSQQQ